MVANSSQHILFSKIYFFYLIFFCSDILFQYTFGFDIFGFKPGMCDDNGENCQRFSGILNQELIAGGYLSTFGILILLHLKNFFFKKELFFNIFTFFIFFSIIVTGERSALIITIIFFIVYYFFTTSIKKYLIILLFLITTILIFSLTSPSFKERYYGYFKSEISKEVQGYNYNLNKYEKFKTLPWILHYSASIEMIKKNLLFGNGFKSFRVKCHEYSEINLRKSNQYQVCSTHPHNFHLELFVDMGVFGLIFFLFWYLNLKNIVNQDKNMISKKNYLFCLIYLIIFIFLFRPTGSIFNSNFASIFWFITSYFFHTINFFDKKKYGF